MNKICLILYICAGMCMFPEHSYGLTKAERKVALHAQAALHKAQTDFTNAQAALADADRRAAEAEANAAATAGAVDKLQKDVDAAHNRELALAKENQKMKPVYDRVNKYWGLGAIGYGVMLLIKHLLIALAVVAVLGLGLYIASIFFPVIGVGLAAVKALLARIFSIFHRKP